MLIRTPAFPALLLASLLLASLLVVGDDLSGADWGQWRGPLRNGLSGTQPTLIGRLPEDGLSPVWYNREDFDSGGGWASPIVAGGNLYQYVHAQVRREDVQLPPAQFPRLPDSELDAMPAAERQAYENNRRVESIERRSQAYEFLDRIVCLSALDGSRQWVSDLPSAVTRWRHSSTPVVDQDRLYYVAANRSMRCLSTVDGALIWETSMPVAPAQDEPLTSSPLILRDRVVVLAEKLMGLDQKGNLVWTSQAEEVGAYYSSPVCWEGPEGPRVIANLGGKYTVCVDPVDGSELWRVDSYADRSTPVVVGDTLLTYGSSRKGGLRKYLMDGDGVQLIWKYQRFADAGSSPVVVGDHVLVQGERTIAAVSMDDGDRLWSEEVSRDRPRYTSLIASGNVALYTFGGVLAFQAEADEFQPLFDARVTEEGTLVTTDQMAERLSPRDNGVAPVTHSQKQYGPRDCVSPAIVDGRLYLRLQRGIACYDLKAVK